MNIDIQFQNHMMSYGSDTESKFIHNDSLIVVEFISIGFSS